MLHPKLVRIIRINYYHLLSYGLMATTLRFPSPTTFGYDEKVSHGYLLYTVFIFGILLLEIPCLLPSNTFDGYMKYNLILQSGFLVSLVVRVSAILGCYITVWWHRQAIINIYKDLCTIWHTYHQVVARLAGLESLDQLQQYLAELLWRNLCVNYGVLLCSTVVQYQLLSSDNKSSFLWLLARFSHMLLIIVVKIGIYLMLLLLNHQFEAVQLGLKALSEQQPIPNLKDLRRIMRMQMASFDLAQRTFHIYDVANATVFLNLFSGTVIIFYHAVLYSNESIKSTGWGVLFGNGLILFNVWGSAVLINMLERVITSCNFNAQILRQFTELKLSKKFEMELELFANGLRMQRLVYKICRCVKLDKSACISYMGTVLGYVIIMMQFDLKERARRIVHHQYLSHIHGKH